MKTIFNYWWDGVKYAITPICAIYAGYLMQAEKFVTSDLFILIIPALTAFFFFMCYALRFKPKKKQNLDKLNISPQIQNIILILTGIIILLLALLIAIMGEITSNELIVAFLLQGVMYCSYGFFLVWYFPAHSERSVRHQLFWSVIMSIGISLYYGFSFSQLSVSIDPLAPVFLIIIFFIADQATKTNKKYFALITFLVFIISVTLAILVKTGSITFGLGESFFTITLCLTISCYLAVFEAWNVTSDIVAENNNKEGKEEGVNITPTSDVKRDKMYLRKRYFIATFYALIVAIWVFPGLFIYSQYGQWFFYGFTLHAIGSLLFWYRYGSGKYIKLFRWDYIKSIAGFLFLGLLVGARFLDTPPRLHIYQGLVSIGAIFGFGGLTGWMIAKLILDYREAKKTSARREPIKINFFLGKIKLRIVNINFFLDRINVVRILCILSFLTYVFLNLVLQRYNDTSSLEYYKMEMALIFYGFCIVICGCLEFLHIPRPKRRVQIANVLNSFIGFLILSRIITSVLIALAVFLPSIYIGRGFGESVLSALPFFLSAIGGFALNDYFDSEKDVINKPYRAIPSGKLSPVIVICYGTIMLTLASVSSILFSNTVFEFILYLICILGVTTYNFFVKYISLSKTFLTAIISSLPLLYSVIVYEYSKIYLLLPIATCCFILGREWLMDIRDIKGDSHDQLVTVAMKFGPTTTARLGFGLQLLAALILLPITMYNQTYWSTLLLTMIFLSVIVFMPLWKHNSGAFQRRVIQLLWLPMLFGLLLFIDK